MSIQTNDPIREANKQRFGDISATDFPGGLTMR